MNRREAMQGIATALLLPCWAAGRALAAGLGFAWDRVPTITVLGAAADPRLVLVRDAVMFWNQTLGELGSGFRLGAVARQEGSLPDDLIVALHESFVNGRYPPFPERLGSIPGDIVVALSDADFISFSLHWPNARGLVAIKSIRLYPMTLPNVARNVIAHELGHAIGLDHNSDPTMLMCGRPALCRPMAFQSSTEHYFPLTADEKALLLQLYPANWHSR
jgi:Matrixin